MGDLKPGWKRWRFDQFAQSVTDRVDDPSAAGVEYYIGLEHLDSESLKIRRWGSPDDVTATKLLFEPGDIIFGRRRSYQRKVGVAEFRGIASAHALVLRAKPSVALPEFLPFFMQSDTFMERAVKISVGGLSPTINWKTLAKQEFTLPPLEEQRRIVRLLSRCLEAVEGSVELLSAAQELFRSLVEQTTTHLAAQRTAPLNSFIAAGRPICYGILKPGKEHPGGVPVVKVRDYPAGQILTDSLLLTDPTIDAQYARSRLLAGDILVSIRGTVGRVAVVPYELQSANITQDSARLSISSDHSSDFVRFVLRSSFVQRQMIARTTGLAVQGLNIGELRQIRLPKPSQAIQAGTAQRMLAVHNAVCASERRVNQARNQMAIALRDIIGGGE